MRLLKLDDFTACMPQLGGRITYASFANFAVVAMHATFKRFWPGGDFLWS